MSEPLITVLTVNYNTSEFIELMLYALRKLTHNSFKVIICDNGSDRKDISKLTDITEGHKNIEILFRNQSAPGSIAHGEALDILIEMVTTKYTVILDSDCTFLIKNWDDMLINQINEKVKIIGARLHTDKFLKPDDFPMPFSVLFETEAYKRLNISCMPGNIQSGEDSCWEWKPKYLNSGYTAALLNAKHTRHHKDGPLGTVICAEYYLPGINDIFASHFGRGSSGGTAKYFKRLRIPFISGYIKRCYAEIEKRKWISSCNEIINGQL
jgi:glycosyltransferase involved in cell wall biosynthesis